METILSIIQESALENDHLRCFSFHAVAHAAQRRLAAVRSGRHGPLAAAQTLHLRLTHAGPCAGGRRMNFSRCGGVVRAAHCFQHAESDSQLMHRCPPVPAVRPDLLVKEGVESGLPCGGLRGGGRQRTQQACLGAHQRVRAPHHLLQPHRLPLRAKTGYAARIRCQGLYHLQITMNSIRQRVCAHM